RQVVAELGGEPPAPDADRRVRVVVDLAALDHRGPLVEQAGDRADEPGLALTALPEEHHVVAGDQGALQERQHRVVEADDAGEAGLAAPEPLEEVLPDLGLDRPVTVPALA